MARELGAAREDTAWEKARGERRGKRNGGETDSQDRGRAGGTDDGTGSAEREKESEHALTTRRPEIRTKAVAVTIRMTMRHHEQPNAKILQNVTSA